LKGCQGTAEIALLVIELLQHGPPVGNGWEFFPAVFFFTSNGKRKAAASMERVTRLANTCQQFSYTNNRPKIAQRLTTFVRVIHEQSDKCCQSRLQWAKDPLSSAASANDSFGNHRV
jgi:hypothetical protein